MKTFKPGDWTVDQKRTELTLRHRSAPTTTKNWRDERDEEGNLHRQGSHYATSVEIVITLWRGRI